MMIMGLIYFGTTKFENDTNRPFWFSIIIIIIITLPVLVIEGGPGDIL